MLPLFPFAVLVADVSSAARRLTLDKRVRAVIAHCVMTRFAPYIGRLLRGGFAFRLTADDWNDLTPAIRERFL